ncbi:MAG: TIGR02530 family flagellar biosynthesis protein [Eubacteriales bacterium]
MSDIQMNNLNLNYLNRNAGSQTLNRTVDSVETKVEKGNVNKPITKIGADFGTLLKEQLDKNSGIDKDGVQFSKHAKERVTQRGIELTPKLMQDLNTAVDKASKKGAKDIVVFDMLNAFIVNVPNKTVVTTMSGSEMRDNVFTNIDAAVIL